ncbi:MAG: metalloregulator ArsR/SmtB family transcription factor [Candidatus Woesearchaeota archaeon]|nr:metalloregulator ArsR/SmtB family transcription factor [Candidatus Woesearchaeota archaeon]
MDISLDKETFKALASQTRVDVLKLLGQRRYMQSEIASVLNFSVPTVKEHLSALEKAGLVERHDEGRKWKYYSLTRKGHGVLHPEELKIFIVLGLFLFSIVGGIYTFLQTFAGVGTFAAEKTMLRAPAAEMDVVQTFAATAPSPINYWPYFFGVAGIVFAVMLICLIIKSYQYKSMLGKSLIKK